MTWTVGQRCRVRGTGATGRVLSVGVKLARVQIDGPPVYMTVVDLADLDPL